MTISTERLREIAASRTLIICTGEDRAIVTDTDTDKDLAREWAVQVTKDGDAFRTHHTRDKAAARYILSTLADDRDARIEALAQQLRAEEDDHRKTLKLAERLAKEHDEARDNPPLLVSFSGGRTSAYMTKLILDNWRDRYQIHVVFANTGLEHPKTLEFIRNCDEQFGFGTVWIESVINQERGIGPGFRVVTFDTAARNGEPFEGFIRKHGIPNPVMLGCTRSLKHYPMLAWMRAHGLSEKTCKTAIGIRADEKRRVSDAAADRNIIYPLVDEWPTDKQDVLSWWEDQPFDLGIEEFEGNCRGCFKKSKRKHFLQMEKDPSVYDWHARMEELYSTVNSTSHRYFFRGDQSTAMLREEFARVQGNFRRQLRFDFEVGGCSESCEVFETKETP